MTKTTAAPESDGQPLTRVYFEYNRAHMSVFRFGQDKWETHNFEVDAATNSINLWETWLKKDKPLLAGHYQLNGEQLVIEGKWSASGQDERLELRKAQ